MLPLLVVLTLAGQTKEPLRVVDSARVEQRLRRAADALQTASGRLDASDEALRQLLDDARQQLDAARGQLRSSPGVDAWVNELKRRPEAPDAGIPPATRAESGGTSVGVERRHVPPTPLPTRRGEPVGEVELRSVLNAMAGQDFRGGKLGVLVRFAPGRDFTVDQIIELLNEFGAPGDRLEALKLLVPGLIDRGEVARLYRACRNETERSTVRALLGGESE